MSHPTKKPAEKLEHGVTVLFGKTRHAQIKEIARAHGTSMGETVRRLIDQALRA